MDFLAIIAIVALGYLTLNTSRNPNIAGTNATIIIPVLFLVILGISELFDTSIGKVLAWIGFALIILVCLALFSDTSKSQ